MKKKNVVKKEAREKKTYERTPIRIQKPKVKKPTVVNKPVIEEKPVVVEKEPIKKQHNNNKRPKPAPVVTIEKPVETVEKPLEMVETVETVNDNVENNKKIIQ